MPLQSFSDRNRQALDGASVPENRVNIPRSTTEDGISPLNYERRLQQTALTNLGVAAPIL